MSDVLTCLHCGQSRAQIKRDQTICGIEEGYEYRELAYEWPSHRWADWDDQKLAQFGIRPEAFDKYRRVEVMSIEYIACDDLVRGHNFRETTESEDDDWFAALGQCYLCGAYNSAIEKEQT